MRKNRLPNDETPLDDPAAQHQPAGPGGPPGGAQKGVLQVVWRRRWWVVLTTVAAVGAALLYLSRVTPIYASSSRIYVQVFNPVGKSVAENLGSAKAESATLTQCELIASEPLLGGVAALPEVRQMRMMAGADNPVGLIRSALTVTPDRDFITIAFESPHNVEAAQLVNLVVQQYQEFTGKQRNNNVAEVLRTLQGEKDKREKELDQRTKEALKFKTDHGILSLTDGEKGNIILQRLSKLSEALTTAQLEAAEAEANFRSVDALKGDPKRLLDLARAETPKETRLEMEAAQAQGDSIDLRLMGQSDALRERIADADRTLARLRRTRTPEHKEVREADADLAVLRDQLARNEREIAARKEKLLEQQRRDAMENRSLQSKAEQGRQGERDREMVDSFVTRVARRHEMTKRRATQLEADFNAQKTEAMGLNTVQAQFAAIESDLRRADKLVTMLEDKIKEINVTEDTGVVKVTPLEVAKPAAAPIRPDRKRVLGIAVLLGLVLGGGVAFGLDAMDQRLRSVEEIMAVIDVPVLGLVPHMEEAEAQSARGRKVQLEPTSDVAEAYRTIRTAVYFAEREAAAKTMLITSPAPGDGKSTTASNLAIAMAQAGRRVLLVDADCRRPTQHKIFGLDAKVGLSSVMAGLESVEGAIQRTDLETLDVMPCGPLPANPAEILNGQGFADLLTHLQKAYDHVVIDSPPVAPVTDARILGAMCDETILVLRANKSTRRLAEHARDSLSSVGTRLIGVIVNDVQRRRDRYGYYYGYGYGYGYYGYGYGSRGGDKAAGNGKAVGNGTAAANGSHGDGGLPALEDATAATRG
jgi:succinoglycan biosynthesis transport protein ExoP